MLFPSPQIALLYDDSGYAETLPGQGAGQGPRGLMGRQVAGKEFLDAYLTHSTQPDILALVYNQASTDSLTRWCQMHPSSKLRQRRLQLLDGSKFHQIFFPVPPARVLYSPAPPDPSFAWARFHGGAGSFALCGITHTLCTANAVNVLCEMVTAPYEAFDTLICTSHAAVNMVRAVTDSYADYLRDRLGGNPRLRIRLEVIPLGVDPEKFRPATPEERAEQRQALKIADDEIAILFVGRLAFHAKAHPFPMYDGIAAAARATGKKIHLILAGWAGHESILNAFVDGARVFAPNIRITFVDGTRAENRFAVWRAADLFTSLSDNIQETFGLVIIEAMACGLPVVASDWNGYRDLVIDGETGLLVPTYMVQGATRDLTSRFMTMGELDYDHFLAECSQAVAVDCSAAAQAYTRLILDADLRRQLGQAGRWRVLAQFSWERIVRAYEKLWNAQEAERRSHVGLPTTHQAGKASPPRYPAPEFSFAGYPTALLTNQCSVQAVEKAEERLKTLLAHPLSNYTINTRLCDEREILKILGQAVNGCSILDIASTLGSVDVPGKLSATVGWMLKFGLLTVRRDREGC